ncbi:MAG: hypothetical protein ACK4YO_03580, partial [Candidatus Altarchaeaceae archaeon]
LSLAINFSEYQGRNATNSFQNPSVAEEIINVTIEFTDYYNIENNSQVIEKERLTCLNCDSIVPIAPNSQKDINLSVSIPINAAPGNYTGNITIKYIRNSSLCPEIYEKRASRIEVLNRELPAQDLRNDPTYTISFGAQYQGLSTTISLNTPNDTQIPNCTIINISVEYTDYYSDSNVITKGNFTTSLPEFPFNTTTVKQINLTANFPDDAALGVYNGNITIKYYCQLFIYTFIYPSNLSVLNKTQVFDFTNDSSRMISFGERCPGLSSMINITTINSSSVEGKKIINISVEFTDYHNYVNNTYIGKGNFTYQNPSLPIENESKLINLIANFPMGVTPGQYYGNLSISYYIEDGRIFKYIFPSNLTVSYVPPIVYDCNVNTTGYCAACLSFAPAVDGTETTANLTFDTTD